MKGKTGKAGNRKTTGAIKNLLIHLSSKLLSVPGLHNAIACLLAFPIIPKVPWGNEEWAYRAVGSRTRGRTCHSQRCARYTFGRSHFRLSEFKSTHASLPPCPLPLPSLSSLLSKTNQQANSGSAAGWGGGSEMVIL